MHKPTITIGIPAYNEEANIKHLLVSVLGQNQVNYDLAEIIVISDGSKDRTVFEAESVNDARILVIEKRENRGLPFTQNEIGERARGDILVMLDADILPVGDHFVEKIIEPILAGDGIDLVSADTVPACPKTFFEKIIVDSHEFKQYMYRKINKGDTIYLCHGRARAFSKRLYKTIRWPSPQHGEDAFSYLFCISRGFAFAYQHKAEVIFRSPSNWRDYVRQSQRFLDGQEIMTKDYPPKLVRKEYALPKKIIIETMLVFLLKKPITTTLFLLMHTYIRFFMSRKNKNFARWETSKTSKRIL